MNYIEHINIYKQKNPLRIPLAKNPNLFADSSDYQYLIIINDEVYIKDFNIDIKIDFIDEGFSRTIFNRSFIEENPEIFEKII